MNVTTLVDPSSGVLVSTVAEKAISAISHAWQQGRVAHVVLTGGRTGAHIAEALDTDLFRLINSPLFQASGPAIKGQPAVLHLWFSDERFTEVDDADRSDTHLIAQFEKCAHDQKIAIHFHRVSTPSVMSLAQAAQEYANELDGELENKPGGNHFDVVLLSMGEDGHVASLFPGLETTAHSTKSAISVDTSPKPPAQRVSISVDRLANSSAIYIFALGEGKREALTNFLETNEGPIALIKEAGKFGQLVIATDLKL